MQGESRSAATPRASVVLPAPLVPAISTRSGRRGSGSAAPRRDTGRGYEDGRVSQRVNGGTDGAATGRASSGGAAALPMLGR